MFYSNDQSDNFALLTALVPLVAFFHFHPYFVIEAEYHELSTATVQEQVTLLFSGGTLQFSVPSGGRVFTALGTYRHVVGCPWNGISVLKKW